MARPQKEGFDYFPCDCGIFQDTKIEVIMGKFGSDGFTFYIYLITQIYPNGYYIKWDDDTAYVAAKRLNISHEKILLMLNFLLDRSLFDNIPFQSDNVLTSRGIQKRFQAISKSRGAKNKIEIDSKYWLLSENDTDSHINVVHMEIIPRIMGVIPRIMGGYSENNSTKVKESKVKESIVKKKKEKEKEEEKKRKNFSPPLVDDIHEYCASRNNGVDANKFYDFYTAKGWKVGNQAMKDWQAAVRTWEKRDSIIKTNNENETKNKTQNETKNKLPEINEKTIFSDQELDNLLSNLKISQIDDD